MRRMLLTLALCAATESARAELGTPPTQMPGLYALHCSGCHGMDGSGMPPAIPNLRASLPRLLPDPRGREYLLRVPGVARSDASPEQIAGILNWIRDDLLTQRLSTPDFTAAEVARARREPLSDPSTVHHGLLPDETY